jgi:hypothetical protein
VRISGSVAKPLGYARSKVPCRDSSFVSLPDIRTKHCAYGRDATMLNPRAVTSFPEVRSNSCKPVAVPSAVHCPGNYKIKNILFKMTFKSVNKFLSLIIYYRMLKLHSYETQSYYNSPSCKRKHLYKWCQQWD